MRCQVLIGGLDRSPESDLCILYGVHSVYCLTKGDDDADNIGAEGGTFLDR